MRAAIKKGFLGTTITFSNDYAAVPTVREKSCIKKKEALIRVKAAAINPGDYKMPRIILGPVVGLDFCGQITQLTAAATDTQKFQVGDVVFGTAMGTLAEYTVARLGMIAKVPKGWKAQECAALPTAYQAALQCLDRGNILTIGEDVQTLTSRASEKSVVIIGASGGCGLAGVQLCKALGVKRIVAICSKRNDDLVRKNGATEVVDYTNASELESFFSENAGKFDCVYDAASSSGHGENYFNSKSMDLLKRDEHDKTKIIGEFTALMGPASKWIRMGLGLEAPNQHIIVVNPRTESLELIVELLDKTGAKPIITSMTFDEAGLEEAFQLLKSRRAKGKLVFDISRDE
jgi:NADPH:quinone reductase-like Zn-dependent oxidoreductase